MKKLFYPVIALSLLLFFVSCSESNQETATTHEEHHDHDHHPANDASAASSIADVNLKLNGEQKWIVDAPTAKNAAHLKEVTNGFAQKSSPTLAEYHAYSNEMSAGISKMVQECRMKGADHDALHDWLEPVMAQNKALKEAQALDDAHNHYAFLHKMTDAFDDYFTEK